VGGLQDPTVRIASSNAPEMPSVPVFSWFEVRRHTKQAWTPGGPGGVFGRRRFAPIGQQARFGAPPASWRPVHRRVRHAPKYALTWRGIRQRNRGSRMAAERSDSCELFDLNGTAIVEGDGEMWRRNCTESVDQKKEAESVAGD
jgi:hypothetical protein